MVEQAVAAALEQARQEAVDEGEGEYNDSMAAQMDAQSTWVSNDLAQGGSEVLGAAQGERMGCKGGWDGFGCRRGIYMDKQCRSEMAGAFLDEKMSWSNSRRK